ncbi:DUF790 family protein [Halobiforma nitratireducens]|uniref:DUF790 family protein n=1 Tax=Halobiforma nitratireducens JCM 10879 TaxID=1227454 RepID=M0MLD1_9EURY|nr:DUF790 family protein [Halobiforma nitratireducens]EMA45524.1 hypothetical protein C446_02105 [Halobiforma nitratireducens JCM 10879]
MLRKELCRVSRAGGGYHPQFADRSDRPLAARVIGTFQGHVGEPRGDLEEALTALERESDDYKLVRGLADLVEREATFETDAPIDPERARRAAFEAAAAVGVVSEHERTTALARAGESLSVSPDDLERSLYADLEERQVLTAVEPRWGPDGLLAQYNLSQAQTALFDATEVRVHTSDPKSLVSAIKRLRLMYEIHQRDGPNDPDDAASDREVVVTGPTRLFRSTRRYGTRFARLLRTVASAEAWHLEATIDDRGTERMLTLSHEAPVGVPDAEPVTDVSFDSGVESEFAARFEDLDLDWELVREPEPLATGTRVMIPDFAFEYAHAEFRIFFEIMGFWTPAYVEKKLSQLAELEDVALVVAVDESLGVGEEIAARDHRAIPYSGSVRVKDVVDVLREYETELVAETAASLPDEVTPDEDAIGLEELAQRRGVSADALAETSFPDHDRVGRTLVRPGVLESLEAAIEPGADLADVESLLEEYGIDDASAVLSRLGYRVEWEGLGGGTVRKR